MFIENQMSHKQKPGWIELICGSMFSGKTEELLRRIKRARIAQLQVTVFKPAVDTRYARHKVVSHDANNVDSITVDHANDILTLTKGTDVVALDEAQFFGHEVVAVCNQLANSGLRVIVAGLDMDFKGRPFGPMPQLLAVADYVTKLHAICTQCGALALYSHRTSSSNVQIVLGAHSNYTPLCRNCYSHIQTGRQAT